jgi:hypothetical protein
VSRPDWEGIVLLLFPFHLFWRAYEIYLSWLVIGRLLCIILYHVNIIYSFEVLIATWVHDIAWIIYGIWCISLLHRFFRMYLYTPWLIYLASVSCLCLLASAEETEGEFLLLLFLTLLTLRILQYVTIRLTRLLFSTVFPKTGTVVQAELTNECQWHRRYNLHLLFKLIC